MYPFRKRWQSIDSKAPLLASALVVGTVLVVALFAHVLLQRSLIQSARERMVTGAKMMASLMPRGTISDSVRRVTDEAMRGYLRGAMSRDDAIEVLSRGNSASDTMKVYGALLDSSGAPVLEYRRDARGVPAWPRRGIEQGAIGDTLWLSPFEDLGGPTASYVRALRDHGRAEAPLLGYIVSTRMVTGRGGDALRQLLGRDAAFLVGQKGVGIWTDLENVLAAPPIPVADDSVIVDANGVGAYAPVAGTAWHVWVGQSRAAVMAPSHSLLVTLIPIGLAVALVSAALMWRFTRSITRPIAQLTDAAENIAADNGDTGMQPTVLMPATANEVARLRYAFERMARRVSERQTLELQLRHAQKMEAVGRLAGGIAHDFNNLLTAIRSYADLLIADTPEWEERRADLLEIRKASERAAALTAQLLAFSRKQMLQPRVLDTSLVLSDLRGMLDRLLTEDVTLAVQVAPGVWPVKADRGQLEQVIVNLAVNARDAMPYGGTIELQALNTTLEHPVATRHGDVPAGQYVAIRVTDTGVGMDIKTQNQVFEPFFTTKPIGQGTGLGLATVHGIVTQSGGYVTVQSEVQVGTTFTVFLPRVLETPVASGSHRAIPAPRQNAETILLVEDEQAVRTLARRVLERAGFRVLEAETPSAALALARAHASQIQLVVSDVVMPEMNGPTLVTKIAELCPAARVLFISGYTDDEIIGRGLSEPGLLLLPKPFSAQELVERVRQALDARPEGISA